MDITIAKLEEILLVLRQKGFESDDIINTKDLENWEGLSLN